MATLEIESSSGRYPVVIGVGALDDALTSTTYDIVLADEFVVPNLGERGREVLAMRGDEASKTLAAMEDVVIGMRERGAHRGSHLLAVGGGVVQDVGTFVASVYMRGIAWTYVPTTLMSMADSCIGGKSSINAGGMKNLVGNIYPPQGIIIDPRFTATLTAEGIAGGLSEAVKICYCRGTEAFARYLELHDALDGRAGSFVPLLHHVLATKKWFIEIDEFDRAERRLLNFGHTFGHAMEAGVGFSISHGVAVSLGILAALHFTASIDGPDLVDGDLARHCRQLVGMVPSVGARLGALDLDRFRSAFSHDKKHGPDGVHVILPLDGAGVHEVVLPDLHAAIDAACDAVATVVAEVSS